MLCVDFEDGFGGTPNPAGKTLALSREEGLLGSAGVLWFGGEEAEEDDFFDFPEHGEGHGQGHEGEE